MEELNINQIDFKWVDSTNDTRLLKKGLKLLKQDGGYFTELEKYIEDKLSNMDSTYKPISEKKDEYTLEDKLKTQKEILAWEQEINKADKILSNETNKEIFEIDRKNLDDKRILENRKLAEDCKIKGNELMKEKNYDSALEMYNRSLQLSPIESAVYCNRALCYLRKLNYKLALEDCDKALEMNNQYSKAIYRRGLALVGLKRYNEGMEEFLFLLSQDTNNKTILNEIKDIKTKWETHVGKEEWEKEIQSKLESRIKDIISQKEKLIRGNESTGYKLKIEEVKEQAKKPEKQEFKKIKIEEDAGTDNKHNETKENKSKPSKPQVPEESIKKFNRIIQTGEQVKKEIKNLLKSGNTNQAKELALQSLKTCQDNVKFFPEDSEYHAKLTSAINELNKLIDDLNQPNNQKSSNADNTKYFKTKIYSEGKLKTATEIAQSQFDFSDFSLNVAGFERAFNSFKKNKENFYGFMEFFTADRFLKCYKDSEVSVDLMITMIETFGEIFTEDNKHDKSKVEKITSDYLDAITKTKKFFITKSFLKKDKERLSSILRHFSKEKDFVKMYF